MRATSWRIQDVEVVMKALESRKEVALRNIMFATDFSPYSETALVYAKAIVRHSSGKLFGAHVLPSESYCFAAPDAWPGYVQQEEQLQEEVVARLEKQLSGVPHEALAGIGDVWGTLSGFIRERHIDLVVLATHGRTGTRKFFMGSIAEKIFRKCSCPVLSVGPNVACQPEKEIQFPRILYATDFGEASLAALPYAISLAKQNSAHLTLVHIIETPSAGVVDLEADSAFIVRRLRELVSSETEFKLHVEYQVEFARTFVRPAERILEIAEYQTPDLIVLGVNPSYIGVDVETHLANSAVYCIAAGARCPVLTVRV
jgi:nucleotide-binding universal stress UspA family protein